MLFDVTISYVGQIMMVQDIKHRFIKQLEDDSPDLKKIDLNSIVSDNLISPYKVVLPQSYLQKIKDEIKAYSVLRAWGEQHLQSDYQKLDLPKPDNYSVCMSYDFHTDDQDNLKLIEINTNAAFLSLGLTLYKLWPFAQLPNFKEKDLMDMFLNESALCKQSSFNLAIMDEKPEDQRLYLEFLTYQSLFQKSGLKCTITDLSNIDKLPAKTLVYNRYTDFYLTNEKSKLLRERFKNNDLFLSPNPYEYFLLADKQRLFDWGEQTDVPKPSSLLKIYDLAKSDKDKIWLERKSLFFKPKASYGSKQAYKGASISRKVFDEAFASEFVAQEYIQAKEITLGSESEPVKLKYDLRCYVYKDQLQMVIARLYQGQTTNLKTVGGGFTVVEFADSVALS